MVLNGAYLVDAGRAEHLAQSSGSCGRDSQMLTVTLTGPWPPYFVLFTPGTVALPAPAGNRNVALINLLDRVLAGGVVVSGEISLSIADVDLVHVSLGTLITSITALQPHHE